MKTRSNNSPSEFWNVFAETFLFEMQYQLSLAWYYAEKYDAHPSREQWYKHPQYYKTAPHTFALSILTGETVVECIG